MSARRAAALSLLLLCSCASVAPDLEFAEQIGAVAEDLGSGTVVSSRLVNHGPDPIRVLSVSPMADPGLRVSYLGRCKPACPGSLSWNDPDTRELIRDNERGVGPFVVPPGPHTDVRLMFRLWIPDPSRAATCPKLRAVALTLVGGTLVVAGPATEGSLASLEGPVPSDAPPRCAD